MVCLLALGSLWALGICCGRDRTPRDDSWASLDISTAASEEKKEKLRMPKPATRTATSTSAAYFTVHSAAASGTQDGEKMTMLEELQRDIHAKDWEIERLKKAMAQKDEDAAKLRVKLEERGGPDTVLAQLKANDDDLERLAASLEAERSTVASQR